MRKGERLGYIRAIHRRGAIITHWKERDPRSYEFDDDNNVKWYLSYRKSKKESYAHKHQLERNGYTTTKPNPSKKQIGYWIFSYRIKFDPLDPPAPKPVRPEDLGYNKRRKKT